MKKKESKKPEVGLISGLDIYIIIAIFLFTFLVRVPFFDYPVVQDSAVYAELSESLHKDFRYDFEGEPSSKYPPGQPFLASLILFFDDDASLAVRLVSVFFSSLTICLCYLFLKFLELDRGVSLLLCSTVFFNPWFFYFTTILGLSEGAGTFFLLLGFFFVFLYFTKRLGTTGVVLGALFFGMAVMIRIVFIAVVGVFCLYFLWRFIHKKNMLDCVLFALFSSLPFMAWFVRNLFVKASGGYGSYISKSISSYPYGLIYFTLIVFPIAFLLGTWYVLKSFKKVFSSNLVYWKLALASFVLTLFLSILAWDLVNHIGMIQNPWSFSKFHIDIVLLFTNPLFASRYFVPFIPFLTVLAGYLFFRRTTKRVLTVLAVYSCLLLIFTLFYNSGCLQNSFGELAPIPSTFVQKADASLQLADFLETKGISADAVGLLFSDDVWSDSMENVLSRRGIMFCGGSTEGCVGSGSTLIADTPCYSAEEMMNKVCGTADCIFESRGRAKLSAFQCG